MMTDKQIAWDAKKAADRRERRSRRRVRQAVTPRRPRALTGRCVQCPHGWKHHTAAGNCRRGCQCRAGADR